jgi:hypothetical protein
LPEDLPAPLVWTFSPYSSPFPSGLCRQNTAPRVSALCPHPHRESLTLLAIIPHGPNNRISNVIDTLHIGLILRRRFGIRGKLDRTEQGLVTRLDYVRGTRAVGETQLPLRECSIPNLARAVDTDVPEARVEGDEGKRLFVDGGKRFLVDGGGVSGHEREWRFDARVDYLGHDAGSICGGRNGGGRSKGATEENERSEEGSRLHGVATGELVVCDEVGAGLYIQLFCGARIVMSRRRRDTGCAWRIVGIDWSLMQV